MQVTFNKQFIFLLISLTLSLPLKAGVIIDTITIYYNRGTSLTLNFDDTIYQPIPYGPGDLQLSSISSISGIFTTPGFASTIQIEDLQGGSYIGIYIDDLLNVSLTSFYLNYANNEGFLAKYLDYYLSTSDSSLYLEYCSYNGSPDTCGFRSETWSMTEYTVSSREANNVSVNEPTTLILLALGLFGLVWRMRGGQTKMEGAH
ncbi:PEP-CTERM sorting domain-containing protein [Agarivorans gilvus]|uniref:Ice-binding protein C-terminal domain-containing protein n=1 Tax=Agarivorans gilvus TaxID=680279 RepID=A0ABQ1HZU0_9ALTE|nr:PEP-CTERM sorting domain-containing protein [Agarivorans gilvus]GGB02816.1 hypothetical protein GCM10007414_15230 [Agarivorans gilvus]